MTSHAATADENLALPRIHGMDQTPSLGVSWNKLMMWLFLLQDAMSFIGLLGAYAFFRIGAGREWPDPNHHLGIGLTTAMTFVLICSSWTMVKALAGAQRGDRGMLAKYLALTVVGGLFFLGCQVYEWSHFFHEGHSVWENNFWGSFFTLTGFHGAHVTGGVIWLGLLLLRTKAGKPPRTDHLECAGLYWHLVDLVWVLIFTFVYLVPNPY